MENCSATGYAAKPQAPIDRHSFAGIADRTLRGHADLVDIRQLLESLTRKIVGPYPIEGEQKASAAVAAAPNSIIDAFNCALDDRDEELRYIRTALVALGRAIP